MIFKKKDIEIKQHDITDCGAACLASICSYYGRSQSVAHIRQLAHTDRQGTNILGLIEGAGKLGFSAKGVRAKKESLKKIPLPSIAHVSIPYKGTILYHYVVIYKVSDKYLEIMDPGKGKLEKINNDEFYEKWTGVLLLLSPLQDVCIQEKKSSTANRLYHLVVPHKSMLIETIIGSILCSILGLATSVYIGKITDYVLVDRNTNLLNLLSILLLATIIIRAFISSVRSIIANRTGQLVNASLIISYYKHILQLPHLFFDTMRVGEIISRINDATKISYFINDTAVNFLVSLLTLIFSVSFMLMYSPILTIIVLCSSPLLVLIYILYNKLNKKLQRRIMEDSASLESQLVESLNGISTVKRFGIESYMNNRTEIQYAKLIKDGFSSQTYSVYIGNTIDLITSTISIIVIWYGSYLVLDNTLSPGSLIMFYSILGHVTQPIMFLINSNRSIQDAKIATERLFQILDLETEKDSDNQIEICREEIGDISFDNVWFRYGTRKNIFNGITLCIRKGKTTAIVGESGSGKTTLGSLIQRMYRIEKGKISIGNYDINDIAQRSLRKFISVVPQRIELFMGSVIDNIALGETEPDLKRITELIKSLNLETLIEGLPNGLYTQVGEKGTNLSGGEAQRLAIARALYKRPEILILDEATSSLDSISENSIKAVMESLRDNGITIIVIAHRLSTVKTADTIIVLGNGEVIEEGSHNQLIETEGLYYKLCEEQCLIK